MCVIPGGGTLTQRVHERVYVFIPIYLALVVAGYGAWVQLGREREPRWLLQALVSIGVGAVWFFVDVLLGLSEDSSLSLFAAAKSTGYMFGAALIVFPGYTLIALSGWVRGLVIGNDSKTRYLA